MNVGFDQRNLAAAAALLVKLAAERRPQTTRVIGGTLKSFDLSTQEGATDYLMSAADDVYGKSKEVEIAKIMEVVYYSLGVVFERAPGSMQPAPLTRGSSDPEHLAYFWQVL